MCVTTAEAKLSNTQLYAGDATLDGKYVHVLAYQNKAVNLTKSANSMILPFPVKTRMTKENVIDTSKFKDFLSDITMATKIQTRSFSKSLSIGVASGGAQVFDSGSYTIVLADDVSQIKSALESVPEDKRPTISDELLSSYKELYPESQIAVCCWDGTIEAEPLLFYYEPTNPNQLFVPTMDAHDGKAIHPFEFVKIDHNLSIKGYKTDDLDIKDRSAKVHYTSKLPELVEQLLPTYVYGTKLSSLYKNGDAHFSITDIKATKVATMKRGLSIKDPNMELRLTGWAA